ncbi:MAG: ATP-binding protein [Synergistaceae bacterium]|nr:ATP-binding protein [Synergistaceae bacterium]
MPDDETALLSGVRVISFVGRAGTGKSQRAQVLARNLEIDFILDDGLVIRKGQIVCGRSAKTERNQVRAIRRAMMEFPDHRQEVREFFKQAQPCTVMIIATSEGMAAQIARRLGLPPPENVIRIEDVATPEEIRRARLERKVKGQHVIPVSQVQVRKNFAGKLVGKLRVFWKGKNRYEGEKTIVRPPFSFIGALRIEPQAIEDLVRHVALRTPQVKSVQEVRIKPGSEGVSIQLKIGVILGDRNLVEIARTVKARISSSVSYFMGLDVRGVDVVVAEVDLHAGGK